MPLSKDCCKHSIRYARNYPGDLNCYTTQFICKYVHGPSRLPESLESNAQGLDCTSDIVGWDLLFFSILHFGTAQKHASSSTPC